MSLAILLNLLNLPDLNSLSEKADQLTLIAEIGVNSGGIDITRRLSNKIYKTRASDSPANQPYLDILSGNIQTSETISLDGSPSFSFSDIEINNHEGLYDSWLLDIWANQPIRIYIGLDNSARSSFVLVFDGIVADIDSKSRNTLNIKVRDKLQRLNTPITETVLGGLSENAQAIIPYAFGECFNVTPLLTDQLNLTYQFCGHASEDVIETRATGAPVSISKLLATGKFNLTRRPFGDITCSVQGYKDTTYYNDIGNLIQLIVLNFGKPGDMFSASDIDSSNFASYIASHTQAVGYYVNDKQNIITIIQELASSLQTQVLCNRLGRLQLHQITLSGTPNRTITGSDMVVNSLRIVEKPLVQSTIMLNYCKNWTPQNNLQTGLANQSRSILADEWRLVTSTDTTVKDKYKQTTYPEPVNSYLVNKTEAQAEADRRLALWKEQRFVFEFDGTPNTANLTIGQTITLQHSRFNLSSGVTGLIIGVTINWKTLRTSIRVLV